MKADCFRKDNSFCELRKHLLILLNSNIVSKDNIFQSVKYNYHFRHIRHPQNKLQREQVSVTLSAQLLCTLKSTQNIVTRKMKIPINRRFQAHFPLFGIDLHPTSPKFFRQPGNTLSGVVRSTHICYKILSQPIDLYFLDLP